MFNAEKLLGKIAGEMLGGSGKKSGGITDSLTSGAGLMTLIGLGVGAFEILKDKKGQPGNSPSAASVPPAGNTAPPPPLPPSPSGRPAPPIPPPPGSAPPAPAEENKFELSNDELARRMIQVMVAAAHADEVMDDAEKQTILEKLKKQGLDPEEKEFLLSELDKPLPIAELTSSITEPATCRTMYMLAVAAITIDTPQERTWLDELARRLNISP